MFTSGEKEDVIVTAFDHDGGRLRSDSFVIIVENDDLAFVILLKNERRKRFSGDIRDVARTRHTKGGNSNPG